MTYFPVKYFKGIIQNWLRYYLFYNFILLLLGVEKLALCTQIEISLYCTQVQLQQISVIFANWDLYTRVSEPGYLAGAGAGAVTLARLRFRLHAA